MEKSSLTWNSRSCGGVEDVVSVLTLVRRGVAQVFHVLRVELWGQLVVKEEEEGKEDGQEEDDRERRGSNQRETTTAHMDGHEDGSERCKTQLEPGNVSVMIKDCETMRAGSVHVVMRHAIVEVRCVHVVIGVHMCFLSCLLLYASFQFSLL